MKPASEGTGVIAGAGVRAVLELGGVKDILAKCLGTRQPTNLVRATVNALQSLKTAEDIASARGLTVEQVLGKRLHHIAKTGQVGLTVADYALLQGDAVEAAPENGTAPADGEELVAVATEEGEA